MYRASIIKSIQYGTVAIANLATSNTATINAVVVANSVVRFIGYKLSGDAGFDAASANLVLTNTTTVTATRSGNTNVLTVYFVVTEYYPNIVRTNQPFTIAMTGAVTTNTATLATAVNVAKTEIVYQGCTYDTNNDNQEVVYAGLTLTNTTTVTTARATATGVLTMAGTAVEFK